MLNCWHERSELFNERHKLLRDNQGCGLLWKSSVQKIRHLTPFFFCQEHKNSSSWIRLRDSVRTLCSAIHLLWLWPEMTLFDKPWASTPDSSRMSESPASGSVSRWTTACFYSRGKSLCLSERFESSGHCADFHILPGVVYVSRTFPSWMILRFTILSQNVGKHQPWYRLIVCLCINTCCTLSISRSWNNCGGRGLLLPLNRYLWSLTA